MVNDGHDHFTQPLVQGPRKGRSQIGENVGMRYRTMAQNILAGPDVITGITVAEQCLIFAQSQEKKDPEKNDVAD